MYKQNISRFQNPTISIPLTNNGTCKRGKVRRILGKKIGTFALMKLETPNWRKIPLHLCKERNWMFYIQKRRIYPLVKNPNFLSAIDRERKSCQGF